MASDYQSMDHSLTPIYSITSGIAPNASTITKNCSMDMANPSAVRNLYTTKAHSPYYNPNLMGNYPIPYNVMSYNPPKTSVRTVYPQVPVVFVKQPLPIKKDKSLMAIIVIVLLLILFMSKK